MLPGHHGTFGLRIRRVLIRIRINVSRKAPSRMKPAWSWRSERSWVLGSRLIAATMECVCVTRLPWPRPDHHDARSPRAALPWRRARRRLDATSTAGVPGRVRRLLRLQPDDRDLHAAAAARRWRHAAARRAARHAADRPRPRAR